MRTWNIVWKTDLCHYKSFYFILSQSGLVFLSITLNYKLRMMNITSSFHQKCSFIPHMCYLINRFNGLRTLIPKFLSCPSSLGTRDHQFLDSSLAHSPLTAVLYRNNPLDSTVMLCDSYYCEQTSLECFWLEATRRYPWDSKVLTVYLNITPKMMKPPFLEIT